MVEELRSAEVIHRDLKPDNIVVSRDQRLYLVDFGSAVESKHRFAMTGRVLTTAHVRAPEVICEGNSYSYPVDVYAAGCVIWTILTGGGIMIPELRSKHLRTKRNQQKFHIGLLRYLLGTSVRNTKNMTIKRRNSMLYHELRTWPARERTLYWEFYKRINSAEKAGLVKQLDRSSKKSACALVSKLI